ncbi:putative ribonuclease H-like domain-containing protein [Tanacetum coccineum]|uniref:Ribonuclease H-like domain-containing protein n=1 Tax=Tanacetum coccineum TaxID=301880 RepID=A0ABQ5B6Q3_9ASTR
MGSSNEENTSANDRFSKADAFHVVPPPITWYFLTPRADISFAGKTNEANTQKPKTIYESVNKDKVIIEDWNSDDEDDVSEVQTVSPVKTNETQTVKTRVDKIGQTSHKQGIGFKTIKACFVCKSTDHLIKDCTFHDRQSQEPKLKTVVNTGPRVDKQMAEQDIPPPTITAMKIPIIRKGEYDIWSMRMRQYICHTDHNLWDVIVNGDLEEEPAPTGETSAPPAPKTAKQLAAKRNQERVKSILLLAIPDEYLLKFHNVSDAKSLCEELASPGSNSSSAPCYGNKALASPKAKGYWEQILYKLKVKIYSVNDPTITPVKQNEKRAVHKVSTARPISTVRPFALKIAQTSGAIRPIYPRMDNVRPRGSYSPIKRSYYTKSAFRPKDLKQDVNTFGVQNMTTAGTRAVVNTGKGKIDIDLKKSRWVWRPKGNYLDHVSKDSGSLMLKKGNPEILLQDHAVVDSGCSSHMTGNKAYLSDYEDYNGGFVAFGSDPKGGKITGKGKIRTANLDFDDVYFVDELKFNLFSVSQMCDKKNSVLFTETECLILSPSFKLLDESQVVLRAPRKDDVYSLDLKNIVPSGGITCLYANATADESKLWHMRLGHVNFKNINKLVKGHLVRGLPSKVFVNDHTCVACKKGKQHKASCKAKLERIIRKPLELLHMDLFGPVSVESINKKRYCLVVANDFSRFSWVFFLAIKDETSEILCNLIIGLENQLSHNVKIIRCDNGTEFKNHAMNELCAKKGIKREFSVARTPQQNSVAERKNKTLIEAARTMLAGSLLPIPF